jgi:hypothetical protein
MSNQDGWWNGKGMEGPLLKHQSHLNHFRVKVIYNSFNVTDAPSPLLSQKGKEGAGRAR